MLSFRTLFEGIVMLPPANTVSINSQTNYVKHKSWWDYDFSDPIDSMTFEEAKEETKVDSSNESDEAE